MHKAPFSQKKNDQNRKPEPLETFHAQTVREPSRERPALEGPHAMLPGERMVMEGFVEEILTEVHGYKWE